MSPDCRDSETSRRKAGKTATRTPVPRPVVLQKRFCGTAQRTARRRAIEDRSDHAWSRRRPWLEQLLSTLLNPVGQRGRQGNAGQVEQQQLPMRETLFAHVRSSFR